MSDYDHKNCEHHPLNPELRLNRDVRFQGEDLDVEKATCVLCSPPADEDFWDTEVQLLVRSGSSEVVLSTARASAEARKDLGSYFGLDVEVELMVALVEELVWKAGRTRTLGAPLDDEDWFKRLRKTIRVGLATLHSIARVRKERLKK